MCIALISTAHPSYPLIVINNRDEYLHRPTSPANYWPPPHTHILGGRDLARATHGTWMGVSTDGKIAVLTNYREKTSDEATGSKSRGTIVNNWLTLPPGERTPTRDFVSGMVNSPEARNVGGFSLVCGYVGEPLAIVSNRSEDVESVSWVANGRGETRGLSNTTFEDRSWPKILDGERLMEEVIGRHSGAAGEEDKLIDGFLDLLSKNTLPELGEDATAEDYLPFFRQSIFIPLLGRKEDEARAAARGSEVGGDDSLDRSYLHGSYGTQKQTVILVRQDGTVKYFERTLYDNDAKPVPTGEGDRSFEFEVSKSG
ncbi:NRDE family protein [Aspergillus melleus]|uniref:NRDE family protein n=1 Tax=Aspergillus melleus TaxID=138277 RepID=UPI001E8EAE20|nr:uncharacterized protein LDX57_009853 [Aspergillus melleus]KAH8432213.1 hypothetical protein LDX57_009853 [Aspergillus melleus]